MIALGVVFIAAFAVLVGGLAANPEHSFRGRIATLDILALFISGLALAIHAL